MFTEVVIAELQGSKSELDIETCSRGAGIKRRQTFFGLLCSLSVALLFINGDPSLNQTALEAAACQ